MAIALKNECPEKFRKIHMHVPESLFDKFKAYRPEHLFIGHLFISG